MLLVTYFTLAAAVRACIDVNKKHIRMAALDGVKDTRDA
jgi:hypothetical protein